MGGKRRITPEDLAAIVYVDDPQCSPNGQAVVYTRQQPSIEENSYTSNLWWVKAAGGAPIQLTYSGKDSQPRWSPNGQRLAFVSTRSGQPQIYLLPMGQPGGEAFQLTQHINGATSPVWSPDGRQIAFLARLNAAERADEDAGQPQAATSDQRSAFFDPLVVDRLPYRDGTTLHDNRFVHLYAINTEGGPPRRLTHQDAHYTAPVWSPDGTKLYTTRIVRVGGDEYWRYASIFEIDLTTGDERQVLAGEHTINDLTISPDGRFLAFNRRDARDTAGQFECCLLTLATGERRVLNARFDRPVTHLAWESAQHLLAVVATEGRSVIYRLGVDGSAQAIIDEPQQIVGLSAAGGLIVTSSATMLNPSELIAYDAQGRRAMTGVNAAFLEAVEVQAAHELWFESPGGRIQGWYLLPSGYEVGRQYPLALNIHGGPQLMWGPHERTLWHEWQCHAAEGYIVFFCNPRGSEGYGGAFNRALAFNWGELAMQDILAGVDAMLATGMVDPQRLVLTGGSFGGFMTAWIIAHDHRFKAAVAQRGVYNLISFFGTTDIPTFAETQFNCLPWEDHDYLWQRSPLAHAKHIQTPLLIIHSENDFRVHIEQAEQLFAWLHRMGKKVRFVRFPRDGHEMTRSGEPRHRLRSLQEMIAWWNAHLPR
jgi:dipeptidyl aminopeptidase/acylaminoacyl peptidase